MATSCVSFEPLWLAEILALPSKWQDATWLSQVRVSLESTSHV
jgi:hypothetical protein